MAVVFDRFIISSSALWAGDFDYFEEQLKLFIQESAQNASTEEELEITDILIIEEAERRLRQLSLRKLEFENLAEKSGERIMMTPRVLVRENFRATIWRKTQREFHLQAYLTDLSLHPKLLRRGRALASQSESDLVSRVGPQTRFPDTSVETYGSLGAAWTEFSDMLLEIRVSDLGLVEARGIWIQRALPDNEQKLLESFNKLLDALEDL